jgi:hypothetical protein
MRYPGIGYLRFFASVVLAFPLFGCSDTANFATGTSIGIAASANTQQVQIGYTRAELFQGPNYPDVGDGPQVVGFLGSDLAVFSPHVRQLYATGDAAGLVTAPPGTLQPCPSDGKTATDGPPNLCAEKPGTLNGERRILVFGTGTSVGLKLGFTGDSPSSINLGYDREELSVIPLHRKAPAADSNTPDKYSSVLASIDLNLTTPNFLGADLKLTQFFATGAAARNLAKSPEIRNYFSAVAASSVNPALVEAALGAIARDQKDIDAYFDANASKNFADVRDKLLKDPALANSYDGMPSALRTSATKAAFDDALKIKPGLYESIGDVARRLNP